VSEQPSAVEGGVGITIEERTSGNVTVLDVAGRMTIETVGDMPLLATVRRLLQSFAYGCTMRDVLPLMDTSLQTELGAHNQVTG
jgi:hypothetical protein